MKSSCGIFERRFSLSHTHTRAHTDTGTDTQNCERFHAALDGLSIC